MITQRDHQNGIIHSGNGFTVFEDTQNCKYSNGELVSGSPVVYGWLGDFSDHDTAQHINFPSVDEAILFLHREAIQLAILDGGDE